MQGILVQDEEGVLSVAIPEQLSLHLERNQYAFTFHPPPPNAPMDRFNFFYWLNAHINKEIVVFFLTQESSIPHYTLIVGFPQPERALQTRFLEIYE